MECMILSSENMLTFLTGPILKTDEWFTGDHDRIVHVDVNGGNVFPLSMSIDEVLNILYFVVIPHHWGTRKDFMPVGVIVNVCCVFLGSLIGTIAGKSISKGLKEHLPVVFGYCAMLIAVNSLVKVAHMPVVILSSIIGFAIGDFLSLEKNTERFFSWLVRKSHVGDGIALDMELYITAVALFCCSGMGIFGVLSEGVGGNHDILFSKALLDFFTAMVFAITLGAATCVIALPQLAVMLSIFFLASFAAPHINTSMYADFSACGGLLTLATAFRMTKIKSLPIINLIPALVLVFPISSVWGRWIPF